MSVHSFPFPTSVLYVLLSCGIASAQFFPPAEQPIRVAPVPQPPSASYAGKEAKSESKDDDDAISLPRRPTQPVDPKQIRLHLNDGLLISGKLSIDTLVVKTTFGDLEVPIGKIKSFTPGLDSKPELLAKINKLFTDLGGDDYQQREAARKELTNYGLRIQNELARYKDDENAERKRQLAEINKALEELEEEQEDSFEDESAVKPWIRGDTIETTEFTIVGRIDQTQFTVASKYGPLKVQIGDIQMADRFLGIKAEIKKSMTVDGSHLAQRSFKSSGIRVEKGDKITVRADGSLVMSPWGNNMSSTPDGAQNFGWYKQNEIPGGALMAKIGSKGNEIKVGSKGVFVAKTSGILQFGIAMQHQYANQGYNFPGQYNVRVKVQPE